MKFRFNLCALSALALLAGSATAQNYPIKPVRMIIAFAAGGPQDVIIRPVGQKLREAFGQPFVVDYKPGANTVIATDFLAKAPADGYTLLTLSSSFTTNPSTQRSLPYDTIRDFTPVGLLARADLVIFVNANLPVKNVKELIAFAKSNPGKLNFASSGTGGVPHLGAELFKILTGINMTHVPYNGAVPATLDVATGTADLALLSASTATAMIKAGKLRIIGVASLKRSSFFPDMPTISEQGVPNFEALGFYGFSARAGTPKPIVDKLNGAIQKILAMDDIKREFNNSGYETWYIKPDELQTWLESEVDKWQKVTKAINYRPE